MGQFGANCIVLLVMAHFVMGYISPVVDYKGPGIPCSDKASKFTPDLDDAGSGQCVLPGKWDPCAKDGIGELCVPKGVFVEAIVFAHKPEAQLCEAGISMCSLTNERTGHWSCNFQEYCAMYSNYDIVLTFVKDTNVLCYEKRGLDVCYEDGCVLNLFGSTTCTHSDTSVWYYVFLFSIGLVALCACLFMYVRITKKGARGFVSSEPTE